MCFTYIYLHFSLTHSLVLRFSSFPEKQFFFLLHLKPLNATMAFSYENMYHKYEEENRINWKIRRKSLTLNFTLVCELWKNFFHPLITHTNAVKRKCFSFLPCWKRFFFLFYFLRLPTQVIESNFSFFLFLKKFPLKNSCFLLWCNLFEEVFLL